MNPLATIAAASAIVIAVSGCSTTPMEVRPTGELPTQGTAAQAEADCRLEVHRAAAGEQNFGVARAIALSVWDACLAAKGYRWEEVTAGG